MSSTQEIMEVYESDIEAKCLCLKNKHSEQGLYQGVGKDGFSISEIYPRQDELNEICEMVRIAELAPQPDQGESYTQGEG